MDIYAHPLFCFMRLQSIVEGTQLYECFHILEESLIGQCHCATVPITRDVSDATYRIDMSLPSVGRSDLRKPRRQILRFRRN